MLDKREKRKNIFKKSRKESYMSQSSVPTNAPPWAVASYTQDDSLSQSRSSTVSCICLKIWYYVTFCSLLILILLQLRIQVLRENHPWYVHTIIYII